MWGFGGKFYWGRNETAGKIEGIVVVFAWMSSQEKHLKNYVQLYSSLGWNSLICHPEFLNVYVHLSSIWYFFLRSSNFFCRFDCLML